VFVKTKRAAQRVLDGMTSFIETKLKLKVNHQKSKFSLPSQSTFLGFCFWRRKGKFHIGISKETWSRFKMRIKKLTARTWGISMQHRIEMINRFTRGWLSYFGIAKTYSSYERWDQWIRKRLRQVKWKQWKTVSAKYRNLRALGASDYDARRWARSSLGFWRIAGSPILSGKLTNTYWRDLGFVGLLGDWMQRNPAV
jgi:RNA-directed DNA polymerase